MSQKPENLSRRSILRMGLTAGAAWPLSLYAQHHHGGSATATAEGKAPASVLYRNQDYAGSRTLAAENALPTGQPLPALPRLQNTSGKAGLFRAQLTAQPTQLQLLADHPTTAWCYNGSTPGPLVEVKEGDTVEIGFHNRLEFLSTIHWHGIATPPEQDGNPPDVVLPGASRTYRYTLPKGSAGTYWYHPHPHEQTSEQVYRGLAGSFIVRAADDPLAHLPEQHLFITDLRLADDGNIPPNARMDWNFNGRYGQFVLVNGALRPHIRVDGTQRWRIWNACNARYLRLTLGGQPFTLVGTDGGLLEKPVHGLTEILLTPAERVEIVVSAPATGGHHATLLAESYNSMGEIRSRTASSRVLASVEFAAKPVTRPVPETLRKIERLENPTAFHTVIFGEQTDIEVARASAINSTYTPMPGRAYVLNGKSYDMDRIDVVVKRGAVEQWDIINLSNMDMDHPFHIHGTQFQVVERVFNGRVTKEPFLAWRDMVNVRAGETVRIRMVQEFEGLRMFHCHILEHEDLGMMGNLMVLAPS